MKKTNVKDDMNDAAPLPATFTTGYKRDLEIARKLVRRRLGKAERVDELDNEPVDTRHLADSPAG